MMGKDSGYLNGLFGPCTTQDGSMKRLDLPSKGTSTNSRRFDFEDSGLGFPNEHLVQAGY